MELLLQVKNIECYYGRILAIKGVSMEVEEGTIVTILGANGAGKSTTLMTIAGLIRPTTGKVSFLDNNITAEDSYTIVNMGISMCPEGRRIFSSLTVKENLIMGAIQRKDRKAVKEDIEHVFSLFPTLKERYNQTGGTLSGGEQQMLAMGRAMMARPELLLLDEPSLGLAPKLVDLIMETIVTLNGSRGMTILLVEQNASKALGIAHRGYVLETGRIILQGPASELAEDSEVRRAYLGRDYDSLSERRSPRQRVQE